jgi:hypothetical protein
MSFTVDHGAVSSLDSTEGSTCATHTSQSLDSCELSASTSTHFVTEPPPLVHVGVSDRFEGVSSDNQLTHTVQMKNLLLQGRHPVVDVCLDALHLSIEPGDGFGLCSFHVSTTHIDSSCELRVDADILTLWPCSAFSPRVVSIFVFGKDDSGG